MRKKVLIIHGWESNSKEHWFLEEKKRLEKSGHEAVVPDMPNASRPIKEEWVRILKNFGPNESSVLIGHSLGGTAILRYLEEAAEPSRQSYFNSNANQPIERGARFQPDRKFF